MHDIVPDSAVSLVLRGQRFIVAYLHVKLLFEHSVRSLKLRLAPCVCDRSHERNIHRNAQREKCAEHHELLCRSVCSEKRIKDKIYGYCLWQGEEQKCSPLLCGQIVAGAADAWRSCPQNQPVNGDVVKQQQKVSGVEPVARLLVKMLKDLGIHQHVQHFRKQHGEGGKERAEHRAQRPAFIACEAENYHKRRGKQQPRQWVVGYLQGHNGADYAD